MDIVGSIRAGSILGDSEAKFGFGFGFLLGLCTVATA